MVALSSLYLKATDDSKLIVLFQAIEYRTIIIDFFGRFLYNGSEESATDRRLDLCFKQKITAQDWWLGAVIFFCEYFCQVGRQKLDLRKTSGGDHVYN